MQQGYWRPLSTSANIYECQNSRCRGGDSYGSESCAHPYTGPFCLGCDMSTGYVSTGDANICQKCPAPWLSILTMFGYNILLIVFEAWYVYYIRKCNMSLMTDGRLNRRYFDRFARGGYLNIFLMYIQILAIIRSFPTLASQYMQVITHIGSPSQTVFYSMDCALRTFGVDEGDIFYYKFVIVGLLPFLKIMLFVCFAVVKKLISTQFQYRTYIIAAVLGIALVEQPGVLSTVFSLYSCKSTDPNALSQSEVPHFIASAPLIQCGTPDYNRLSWYVSIPSIIFWGVVFPLTLTSLLTIKRKQLNTPSLTKYCGGLYAMYKSRAYMWGQLQMFFKMLLIGVSQLTFATTRFKGLTATLVIVLYLTLMKHSRPYRLIDLYTSDMTASYLFLVTLFLALYAMEGGSTVNIICSIIIITINCGFGLYMLVKSLHFIGLKKVADIIAKFLSKLCCCFGISVEDSSSGLFYRQQNTQSRFYFELIAR